MSLALELRGISKRHAVGIGGCMASVAVLRGVSADIQAGEAIAIIGGAFAGKSTLLLCAAGLMVPESGEVRWFGESDRATAMRRATYHFARRRGGQREGSAHRQLPHAGRPHVGLAKVDADVDQPHLGLPHLHFIDGLDALAADAITRTAEWIERRRARGDTIVVATRDAAIGSRLATRCLTLRAGQLHGEAESRAATPARVAERAR